MGNHRGKGSTMHYYRFKALGMVAWFAICFIGAIAYSNWWFNIETVLLDADGGYGYSETPYFRIIFPLFIFSSLFLLLFSAIDMTARLHYDVANILFLWPVIHLLYFHLITHARLVSKCLSVLLGGNQLNNTPAILLYLTALFIPIDVFLGVLISLIAIVIFFIRKSHNNDEAIVGKINLKIKIAFTAFIFNLLWALNIVSYTTLTFLDAIARS